MLPSAEEYNSLRKAVKWRVIDRRYIDRAFSDTLYSICALYKNRVIGFARVIGDSGIYFYIQDVIVLPEHQGQGVGTALMQKVMDYLKRSTPEGAFIGLMSAKGKEGFYCKFGFQKRPDDRFGSGMCRYNEQIERAGND